MVKVNGSFCVAVQVAAPLRELQKPSRLWDPRLVYDQYAASGLSSLGELRRGGRREPAAVRVARVG
ncbi:hypothetical protein SAMN05216215_100576 [Saccharopolyspora shandongensis]|uniref:Uncharacterized protein n=1 Tax=Saccharopolyspora shandongensis TaxID=418495 RepID=A0A1H2W7H5_9PSEU|nr:hypothetical protein SAMN05216215_100576 [Saccharopolyspora shandongensis]